MTGIDRSEGSSLSMRTTLMPSSFGIMMSSRIRSGLRLRGFRKPLFAIRGGHHLVAIRLEAHAQDLEILRRVVDGENARRIVQDAVSFRKGIREPWQAACAD